MLMDLLHSFQKRWWYRNVKKGTHVGKGRVIRASSDCILGTDRRRFKIVVMRGLRNFPQDNLFLRDRIIIHQTEDGHQCDAEGLASQMGMMHGGREDTQISRRMQGWDKDV